MSEHAGVVRRREDPRLITGAGEFVDDLRVPGCLHAAMLRTPHAHARIRGIDVADKIVNLPKDRNDNPEERIEISKVVVPQA